MKTTALIAATLTAGTAVLAAAPASADEIDWRQHRQQQRIEQGVRSGEINRWEYRRLQGEQARIAELERRAARDGHIDRYEREQIRQAQNDASRNIYRQSHDTDSRWGGWGWRRWWW
jgi:hypothetical protein